MLAETAGVWLIFGLSLAVMVSFVKIVIALIIRHRDRSKTKGPVIHSFTVLEEDRPMVVEPLFPTVQSAHKATRRAFWCSVVIAVFTGSFSFLAACGNQSLLEAGITPWSLIDASLLAGIAIGLYWHSRFAAVAGLVFGLANILALILFSIFQDGYSGNFHPARFAIPILFTFVLLRAVRATFAYQRLVGGTRQKGFTVPSPPAP